MNDSPTPNPSVDTSADAVQDAPQEHQAVAGAHAPNPTTSRAEQVVAHAENPTAPTIYCANYLPLALWMAFLTVLSLTALYFVYQVMDHRLNLMQQQLQQLQSEVPTLPRAVIDAIIDFNEEGTRAAEEEQLDNMRQQARAASNAELISLNTDGDASIGSIEAQLVMMELSDLNCGFCGRFHQETLASIKENFVDTGKLRLVYRDYTGVGGAASQGAAAAAECAREQLGDSAYFDLISAIYDSPGRKSFNTVVTLAGERNLDLEALNGCIQEGRYISEVEGDTRAGQSIGIRGTPGFFLGYDRGDGMVDGIMIQGALPYAIFEEYIEGFLN